MGVYIKGMEKPKSCEECRFCVNGWCYVLRPESEEERKRITTNYCPLIEIPPHGRLIDADALPRFGGRRGLVHSKDIDEAPTIIPGEGK